MALPLERLFTAESYERIVAKVDGELAPDHAMPKNYEKNYELQLHHKNGNLRWLEVSSRSMLDDDGISARLVGIARDITDSKAMQLELAEREENY